MTRVLVCLCMVALLAGQASADIVATLDHVSDWTTINDAYFLKTDPQSTGTGLIDPFLRIQANGAEQGYNTDGAVPWDTKNDSWTSSLLVTAVPKPNVTMPDGTPLNGDYWEFLLDINQNGGSLLSLNRLQIYRGDNLANYAGTPYITSDGYDWANLRADLGDPIFDLDTTTSNNRIDISYDLPGSGVGDVYAYIPVSGSGTNLLLYAQFGVPGGVYRSNDGFEEWAVRGTSVVPVPGAVILGMLGMSVAGWRLRRFA